MSPSPSLDPTFFRVAEATRPSEAPTSAFTAIHVEGRALDGMQKEAIVSQVAPVGATWRMVSDEGPYLNGTDLAPFPLAFFTAGQQFCLMSHIWRLANRRGIAIDSLDVGHDNRYSMTGSMLRGDMTGGARPAESLVAIASGADPASVATLVRDGVTASGSQAVMRDVLTNRFTVSANGRDVALPGLPSAAVTGADPVARFDRLRADASGSFAPDIMTKVEAVEKQHGVEGGVASSLESEQHRTLHVRGDARIVSGSIAETTIRLFQPLGSSFRLVADLGSDGPLVAPPPLAYLSAGIAFCFMTQLGRYSQIKKQRFDRVRIVQDTVFREGDRATGATADPVDTHVFLDTDETDESAAQLVRMGEQTCFLHAAMRGAYPSRVTLELNGAAVALPNA
jgi:uncharacterized OsmC-like protein